MLLQQLVQQPVCGLTALGAHLRSQRAPVSYCRSAGARILQLSINPTLNGKLILMAINSVRQDHVCRATSGNYRLDTATARNFLKNLSRCRKHLVSHDSIGCRDLGLDHWEGVRRQARRG
jgi:hypothetical protein